MSKGIVRNEGGRWWIDSSYESYIKPELITNRYRILGAYPHRSNYGPAPELAAGLEVDYERDSSFACSESATGKACRWSFYKHGARLIINAETDAFEQAVTPVECPRVKKGIEVRWQYGRWEKYLSSRGGWVPA